MRVLKWIIDRVHDRVGAQEGPVGLMPYYKDLDLNGLDFTEEKFKELMAIVPEQASVANVTFSASQP
jgi:phosphoenolpyruvate carboxykinase (GTP)